MDDIDRKLMLLICEDPRMPVQELAKKLKVSRQTVNYRLRAMMELGVFRGIRAAISIHYLDLVPVYIWGKTTASSIYKMLDRFEGTELVDAIIVLGGNEILVVGAPRTESDLDSHVEFVKRTAELEEPTVGIPIYGEGGNPPSYDKGRQKRSYRDVSPIDLKIISSLDDNVRKPIAEIARNVRVSGRTVKRHLERMKREGVITFDMPWDTPSGEDMFTLLFLNLRPGADRAKVSKRLFSRYPIRATVVRTFSNLPSFLMVLLRSDSMRETRRILREVSEDKDVVTAVPNTIYLEREYWSWDQKLPATLTRPAEKARKCMRVRQLN